ncbi:hypothetical protein AURDEDRAFT_164923 [Auricularia subglabra TFB-10046 SS5]|nr:hypothetical protein AURDEDRAFT_164923 [Auricularia subglabra TFB-10046 SS5]
MNQTPPVLLPAIGQVLPLHRVPEVHRIAADSLEWDDYLWPAPAGSLAIRVRRDSVEEGDMAIIVSSLAQSWRRVLHVCSHPDDLPSPLDAFPFLGQVTFLRLDNGFLGEILQCSIVFPALTRVTVDLPAPPYARDTMLWPPAWDESTSLQPDWLPGLFGEEPPEYIVSCPRLAQLTILASNEHTLVDSREALRLGRALGWGCSEPPQLRLVGVGFATPGADPLLPEVFSSVEFHASAGKDSISDWDSGLWDYIRPL